MKGRNISTQLEFDLQVRQKHEIKNESRAQKFLVHECNETDIQKWWNFDDAKYFSNLVLGEKLEDSMLFCIDKPDQIDLQIESMLFFEVKVKNDCPEILKQGIKDSHKKVTLFARTKTYD